MQLLGGFLMALVLLQTLVGAQKYMYLGSMLKNQREVCRTFLNTSIFTRAVNLKENDDGKPDLFLRNNTTEVAVVSFHDVWNRSSCQPLEKLVDIVTEYPSEVEHVFSPSCVSLRRCSGCCGDEKLQCVATETTNITMQLLKMKPEEQAPYVELSFTEHSKCACRPRQSPLKSERRKKPKERSKRKRPKQKPKD